MAESNRIRFLLFVSLMIFPAHALDVFLSSAHEDFKQQSEISTSIMNGQKVYNGTFNQLAYQPGLGMSKVIVYIIGRSRFVEIIRHSARDTRLRIAHHLKQTHCELVFLGIENFDVDEHYLISAFMANTIRPPQNQINFTIATIGENHFDYFYRGHVRYIEKYQENAEICGGNLLALLRSIPRGAFRPVGSNEKEIRLYGYYPTVKEVTWPVHVADGKYSPDVNVNLSDPTYNFRIKYPKKEIHLLILGGKEYSAFFSCKDLSLKRRYLREMRNEMKKYNEVLLILGAFNFEWTEIDILTQVILKHSVKEQSSSHDVYTCGYGMFNTQYLNVYEENERYIMQEPNAKASQVIKVLMGGEPKERIINLYYPGNGWQPLEIPIELGEGKYVREERFDNLTFTGIDQNIAFIVYDPAEMKGTINQLVMSQSVRKLKRSNISVVAIEAINFELHDMHIIAEWIDLHRGAVRTEQIAVLGGGIFDTIFQSVFTTYNTFFNIKKSEMIAIRDAFVKSANRKHVFAAKVDSPNFEVWSYSMHTINGCYERDLMSDKNMFDTTGEKKIFFIITSAHFFHQISSARNAGPLASLLRETLKVMFPNSEWNVFLVGLDNNFGERDSHLFAELIKKQTHGERPLAKFVLTFNYGIDRTMYQYKDTEPIPIEIRARVQSHIIFFFGLTCRFPDGTPLPA